MPKSLGTKVFLLVPLGGSEGGRSGGRGGGVMPSQQIHPVGCTLEKHEERGMH